MKIRIRVAGTLRTGDSVTVRFNRDPSDPGPELRLTGVINSEYAMRRVHTWNGPGQRVSCDLYKMKQFADQHGGAGSVGTSYLRFARSEPGLFRTAFSVPIDLRRATGPERAARVD